MRQVNLVQTIAKMLDQFQKIMVEEDAVKDQPDIEKVEDAASNNHMVGTNQQWTSKIQSGDESRIADGTELLTLWKLAEHVLAAKKADRSS